MLLEGVLSCTPFQRVGSFLFPDSSTSLCSRKRCFSIFWVPTAEKLDVLGLYLRRQGPQTHFLLVGESQAWMPKPCCYTHEVCLPARSEIEKPGNLVHGKIFQSSGKASGLAVGALDTSQSGVGRCLTGSLASIEFWKEQDALQSFVLRPYD
jgi:hypothetical protein